MFTIFDKIKIKSRRHLPNNNAEIGRHKNLVRVKSKARKKNKVPTFSLRSKKRHY